MNTLHDVEKIIVLDYGSQYNQLITRRIREMGVYSELQSHRQTAEEIVKQGNVKGIILSGGPNSVYEEGSFDIDPAIFDLDIPVLGICYGMQLITKKFGGIVEASDKREYGQQVMTISKTDSCIFKGLACEETVLMSHGDRISQIPEGFEISAFAPNSPVAAFEDSQRRIYGFQYHPEVRSSLHGNLSLIHISEPTRRS